MADTSSLSILVDFFKQGRFIEKYLDTSVQLSNESFQVFLYEFQ